MTRIIAGAFGGLRLATPKGESTRPTSDRVRESLFSSLQHAGLIDDARVLDLFAGSGALGLESLSRGARKVVLVDRWQPAVAAAKTNVTAIVKAVPGCQGSAEVVKSPVDGFLDKSVATPFDLIFADPPYPLAEAELAALLAAVTDNGWLEPGGVIVVERSSRSPEPVWPEELARYRRAKHGETMLWFAERPI
ncbi:16S rRNA (guanine(966)-N(2))-methyltransferase RsmD [Saxibacter everestensis]|uniref:16S rRNA (Guanine(966)-N(2))-methyltransferase RsmD n=1 Tax=Saxibacter everestensis TaxID=2909229 RepID=A0ABY8QVK3_9MICO|nr:16S rRNA (guanine(966)-N(2))-methyltransferase RsmD [Brevibacteriaceae bacterium ZFBP1038]